jgi:hypothetical protein
MKTEVLGDKIRSKIGFLRSEKETWGGKRNLLLSCTERSICDPLFWVHIRGFLKSSIIQYE